MKLVLILSIIAYGYADKLDRVYLPPANAASSGGSPGSLTVPGVQPEAFGQGLPISGSQPALSGFGKPIINQNEKVRNSQNNQGSATGFGSTFNPSGTPSGNGFGPSTRISATSEPNNAAPSAIQQFSSNGYRDSNQNLPSTGDHSQPGTFNQGFRQGLQGANGIAQEYNQERPQAAAERSAETLIYINENNGESYSYSFETSNGISAEESGIATNGVIAQGGYAYTGDDGKAYSISYTADENGYQPQGEHLPTPHPIPEEILKSIEENAKAAAAGIQEGAYHPEEYESEVSEQQYNIRSGNSYKAKPGQAQSEVPAYNPTQTNQYQATNQGIRKQNLIGQSGQNNPVNQQYNKDTVSGQKFGQSQEGQTFQNNEGLKQKSNQSYRPTPSQSQTQGVVSGQINNQSPNRGSSSQNFDQLTQNQGNGYQYNQPQNAFQQSTFKQGAANQYNPHANSQGSNTFTSGPSTSGSVFNRNQDNLKPSFGNPPSTEDIYGSKQQISSGQLSTSANRPSPQNGFNRPQNQLPSVPKQGHENQNNQPFGFQQSKPTGQGYQYQAKQPSLGFNKPSIVKNAGSQNEGVSNQPSFNSNIKQKQGPQPSVYESVQQLQQSGKQPSYESASSSQNEQLLKQVGQSPQFSQNANKPSFNYNQTPNKNSQYPESGNQPTFGNRQPVQGSQLPSGGQRFGSNTFGQGPTAGSKPAQAPYQYNKPSQSLKEQPSNFLPLESQRQKGQPGQGSQDRSENFGGPRQPPSFNSQEGYKY